MARQKGAALLLTLWTVVLLSVLAGSALLVARSEALRARQVQIRAEALAAADGALRIALHELSSPDATARGIETRPMKLQVGSFEVDVTFRRESGKIDLNHTSPLLIAGLMRQLGHDSAPELARGIEARRAQPRTPDLRVFESVFDLAGLGRLDVQTAACAVPHTTIYTGASEPDLAYATPVVAAAVSEVRGISQAPASGADGGDRLPAGQLFEVTATANEGNSVRATRRAVVRITGNPRKPALTRSWHAASASHCL